MKDDIFKWLGTQSRSALLAMKDMFKIERGPHVKKSEEPRTPDVGTVVDEDDEKCNY